MNTLSSATPTRTGQLIRAARKTAGKSLRQLARELGLRSPSALSFWETGRELLPADRLGKVCSLLPELSSREAQAAWAEDFEDGPGRQRRARFKRLLGEGRAPRRIYSRYWYVRTDTHVYDPDGGYIELSAMGGRARPARAYAAALFARADVALAKRVLSQADVGTPRAVCVTVYKRAKVAK
jgi:transcriptional regulator with XRE-family HTH domain